MIVKARAVYRDGRVEFSEPQKAPPDGTPVLVQYEVPLRKSFSAHFGVLSDAEAAAMMAAIEEGCEQVDRDEW